MKKDQEGIKSKLGEAPHGLSSEIFKKSQASKLGDAQGIPFFIENHRFLSWYKLCSILGALVFFYFQFVCVLFSVRCNKLNPCMLVGFVTPVPPSP